MILIANFNELENSLLQKVAEELGIGARCTYLSKAVSSTDDLVETLGDTGGTLPRIVIVNLESLDADWADLLGDLKAHEIWRFVPVLGFARPGDTEAMEKFYALGGASCIEKPHGYEGLKKITDVAIRYWLDVSYLPCDFLTSTA